MKKVLILTADKFEDTELLVPYYRLREEGIGVTVASLKRGKLVGKHGYEVKADASIDEVGVEEYDALVLPGGKAPATLRKSPEVLDAARHFMEQRKPVAAICHGPQVLVSAGLLDGRRLTCYESVKPEVEQAGAKYEDKEVVVDKNLVTSRKPKDLPSFMREFMKKLNKA